MKRILNFVVILLTTLSIVNALNIPLRKRATTFAACPSKSPPFNGASIDPDPPTPGKTATAKFSVQVPATLDSGKVATDITDAEGKSIGKGPTEQDVCTLDGVTCPVQTGSTIAFEIPVDIPDDAPDTYNLQYTLVDGTGKELACSSGPVTGAPKGKGDDAKGPGDGDGAPGPAAPGPGPPDGGDGKGGDGKAGPGPDDGAPDGDGGDGPKAKDGDAKTKGKDGPPPPPDGPVKGPDGPPDGPPDGGPDDGGPTPP